jgi:hypothetical protein
MPQASDGDYAMSRVIASPVSSRQGAILVAELITVAYLGLIAGAAEQTGVKLLLFPELAAVTHDVLTRPWGKWASQPLRMVVTPTLTAVVGLVVARLASYGVVSVLALVLASLAVIKLLRTTMSPAISACVLPMALDLRHWSYPPAIGLGLVGLTVIQIVWRRWGPATRGPDEREARVANPVRRLWLPILLEFVLVLSVVSQVTGLRFILFPPLIVMTYEVFSHAELPGWITRPALVPLVCTLTGSIGLLASRLSHASAVGVVATLAVSMLAQRIFKIHIPPALAVGLLPFVIPRPDVWYVASVATGTTGLALCSLMRFQATSSRPAGARAR